MIHCSRKHWGADASHRSRRATTPEGSTNLATERNAYRERPIFEKVILLPYADYVTLSVGIGIYSQALNGSKDFVSAYFSLRLRISSSLNGPRPKA